MDGFRCGRGRWNRACCSRRPRPAPGPRPGHEAGGSWSATWRPVAGCLVIPTAPRRRWITSSPTPCGTAVARSRWPLATMASCSGCTSPIRGAVSPRIWRRAHSSASPAGSGRAIPAAGWGCPWWRPLPSRTAAWRPSATCPRAVRTPVSHCRCGSQEHCGYGSSRPGQPAHSSVAPAAGLPWRAAGRGGTCTPGLGNVRLLIRPAGRRLYASPIR
jgi:hypothetical protein